MSATYTDVSPRHSPPRTCPCVTRLASFRRSSQLSQERRDSHRHRLVATRPSRLHAAPTIRETEHFWCHLAPEGPYIDSQRDHKAFGFGEGKIFYSEDNAKSWAHSTPRLPMPDNITFSCFLKNGNILFATRKQVVLEHGQSQDPSRDHRQGPARSRLHSAHAEEPRSAGLVLSSARRIHTWTSTSRDARVGELLQRARRARPVNIYYSTDGGETVKIAYSFGRNPKFQEPDTDPANYLGDPTTPSCAPTFTVSRIIRRACLLRLHGRYQSRLRQRVPLAARRVRCQERQMGMADRDLGQFELALQVGGSTSSTATVLAADANGPKPMGESMTAASSAVPRPTSRTIRNTRCCSTPSSRWPI